MTPIPDFTDAELAIVRETAAKRYGNPIEIELADSELRLDPGVPVLTTCPAVFWSEHNANFVICKTADRQFRCQFFYSAREQFGTGNESYDDLRPFVTVLSQVQADHERQRAMTGDGPVH